MRALIIVYTVIGILFTCMSAHAEAPNEVEGRFVEIIVKVEKDTIVMPEGRASAPLEEIEVESEDLEELNKKFNILRIDRIFAKRPKEELAESSEDAGLEDIFVFRFSDLNDVGTMIGEYEALEEVEYAEVNKAAKIF